MSNYYRLFEYKKYCTRLCINENVFMSELLFKKLKKNGKIVIVKKEWKY
jgi:hypothetical protein